MIGPQQRGMGQAGLISYLNAEQLFSAHAEGAAQFEERQFCPIGRFSDNPLFPGVCNQTILAGAALFFMLFLFFGRRG